MAGGHRLLPHRPLAKEVQAGEAVFVVPLAEQRSHHLRFLMDFDTDLPRALQQDAVVAPPVDLPRVVGDSLRVEAFLEIGVHTLGEEVGKDRAIVSPFVGEAAFDGKTRPIHCLDDAELVKHGIGIGERRFPDVMARKHFLLEQHDSSRGVVLLQQDGSRATGRTGSNDDGVC
jgi:hypothetical protein